MAMRGRGGRFNPSRPPRTIIGRKYEQFKPMSEWRQEDGYDTLLIYLPGFQKEFIKVTTEDLNIVRVRGERLVAENKWSRFQEDYRVPENCEMRGIRAKFDGGILTITMPRKTTTTAPPPPPPPPPLPATTTSQLPPKTNEQPSKRTKQEEAVPELKEELKEKKPDKPQTVKPPPPQPPATATQLAPKPEEPKEKKSDKPQTTPLQSLPKPTSTSAPTKQEPSKLASEPKEVGDFTIGSLPLPLPKYTPKKDKHDTVEKPSIGEKTDLDRGKQKEALHEEEMKRDLEGSKGTTNYTGAVSGGFKKMGWMVNEDRKALMNVGVGVLVIVALGIHVSYTIGLLTKEK